MYQRRLTFSRMHNQEKFLKVSAQYIKPFKRSCCHKILATDGLTVLLTWAKCRLAALEKKKTSSFPSIQSELYCYIQNFIDFCLTNSQGRAQEFCQGGAGAGAKRQRLGCRRGVWGGVAPQGAYSGGLGGASPGKILKFNPLNYAFNGTFSMNFQKKSQQLSKKIIKP